jgi:transposase
VNDRRVLNGIFWVLRSGAPWRDVPDDFGPYTTCYNRFVRWRRAGVWSGIMDALAAAHDASVQMIDTSIVRVRYFRNTRGLACPLATAGRLAPDVLERLRRHRGIAYRVRDAGVAKEVLQSPRIHASVGQGIAGRMPDHVDVNRKRQLGGFTGSLDHACNPHATKRLASLVHEHPSRFDALLGVMAQ